MKPEWKKKWIKALTSGKYKQTREQLRSERNGFCCLGVLCDVVQPESWEYHPKDECAPGMWTFLNEDCNLPGKIGSRVDLISDEQLRKLVTLNDKSKANFTKIAAWIKDNL